VSEPLTPPPRSSASASTPTMFAGNLLLALGWVAMSGHFDVLNLLVGFGFGYLVLYLLQRVIGRSRYFTRTLGLVRFIAFYVLEVVRANLRVAFDVVTPTDYARPGIVAVPLDARTPAEITLLSNLITMTPGTLAVDVADDGSVIYVHAMYLEDPDELRRQIKDDLERRVLELLR
jgi:multicomponent Na+:H+ antiporter subunit E